MNSPLESIERSSTLLSMFKSSMVLEATTEDGTTTKLSEPIRKLFLSVIIIEIIFMSILLAVSGAFLIQSCRQKQHTARFIIKLLILTVLVSISGLLKSIHEAPWLQG